MGVTPLMDGWWKQSAKQIDDLDWFGAIHGYPHWYFRTPGIAPRAWQGVRHGWSPRHHVPNLGHKQKHILSPQTKRTTRYLPDIIRYPYANMCQSSWELFCQTFMRKVSILHRQSTCWTSQALGAIHRPWEELQWCHQASSSCQASKVPTFWDQSRSVGGMMWHVCALCGTSRYE